MNIQKLRDVRVPTRGTPGSAGWDFYVPVDFNLGEPASLNPGEAVNIPAGIRCEVPPGHALIAFNKSGMALQGLQVGACVVDEDYQGEVHLHVFNFSTEPVWITPGQKLVQFLLIKINYEEITITETGPAVVTQRGEGAFGSTGLH